MSAHRTRPMTPSRLIALRCTIALCLLVATASLVSAQTVERPWLAEVNLYPMVAGPVARLVADETVEDVSVDGRRVGFTVARRLSSRVSASYQLLPGLDIQLEELWGFGASKDGRIVLDHRTGAVHTADLRWHPRGGGLQLSGSLLYTRPTTYAMRFARTGATVALGQGVYATDLDATWTTGATTRAAVGVAYSRTLQSGMTLTAGLTVPWPPRGGTLKGVVLTPRTPGVAFSAADVAAATQALDREVFNAPLVFRFGIGYAFGR